VALRGTDPESYVTEYTLVYEEKAGPTVALRFLGTASLLLLSPFLRKSCDQGV
jgi:hypothetical protein